MTRQTSKSAKRIRKVTDQDYRMLADFRHALRQFPAFSEEAARESGLPPQQHQAILAIRGYDDDGITVGELAERLLIRHHSAVELVNRLAEAKLVIKSEGADKRQVVLTLTRKAETILEELSAIHLEELKRSMPLLQQLFEHLHAAGQKAI